MAGLRIVLDTNVLVSGLAYPTSVPGRIVGAWRGGRLDVLLSRFILAELLRALPRLNHRLQWREEDMLDMVDTLALLADLVEPSAADGPVLGTLIASGADYLVTGDKDLLVLAPHHAIVTPAWFWAQHGIG
ncbi:MAG: putative toxin-antitoxin system toxin component, PIN family [Betaproteobacteria bacterium]